MAVVEVSETYRRVSSQDQYWKRVYRREFQVITDNRNDGPKAIREALPVSISDSYSSRGETDAGSYCQTITVECVGPDGKQWTGLAEYGPYDAYIVEPKNPVERPMKVDWGFTVRERVLLYDFSGKPILNSAGERFDPPLVIDEYFPLLTISRCELTNDPSLNYQYANAVNADTFMDSLPGTVRAWPIEATLLRDQDIGWYYSKTYKFEFDASGWNRPIIDQGLRQLLSGALKSIYINGNAVTEPFFLDGNGQQLKYPVKPADVVLIPFDRFVSLPFGVFNITPDSIPSNSLS